MHVDQTTYLMGVKRIEIDTVPSNGVIRIRLIPAESDSGMSDQINLHVWGSPHGKLPEIVQREVKRGPNDDAADQSAT